MIEKNSVLMTIPLDSTMTKLSCKGTPIEGIADIAREDDVLALLILFEKFERGEKSRWYKHLRLLPGCYHSISNYTDSELEYIEGCNLYSIGIAWKQQIHEDFISLRRLILLSPNEDITELISKEWFTLEAYHWALCTIWSRFISVAIPDSVVPVKAMVPLVDFFNHSSHSLASHVEDEQTLKIVTGQEWNEGEEIYISYGLVPNSKLLMLYGFCIINNPNACVDLWASIDPTSPNYGSKLLALSKAGINPETDAFKLVANMLPTSLLTFIRIQEADVECMHLLLEAPNDPISKSLEQKVCDKLEAVILSLLARYKHSLDSDKERLRTWGLLEPVLMSVPGNLSGGEGAEDDHCHVGASHFVLPSQREQNAVILCYSEKVVLHSVLDELRKYASEVIPSLP